MTLHSFDLFDTLLVRRYARPWHLFSGSWLRGGGNPEGLEEWVERRRRAERESRALHPFGETTLEGLYAAPSLRGRYTEEELLRMEEAEREEERWALSRVPETARLVEELHGRGEPVIYTTDMYLPETFLREILVREGLWREGDRLYLSCLQGVGKNRGLFRLILERENLPSEELLHTGDNREADLVAPQREKIPVRPYRRCSLTKREALLADDRKMPLRIRSLLAGLSRRVRLSDSGEGREGLLWERCADTVAPILTLLTLWILRRAREEGIERLYFLSRDGQILKEIAQALGTKGPQLRYLYASRQAWHPASWREWGEYEQGWLLDGTRPPSPEELFRRLAWRGEWEEELFRSCGFGERERRSPLSEPGKARLFRILETPLWTGRAAEAAEERRGEVRGYLLQEGLGDDLPWAVVDIGWKGRLQDSLSRVLGRPVKGFYLDLDGGTRPDRETFSSLFSGSLRPARYAPLLELLTAGDHGPVEGYLREEGLWKPRLSGQENREALEWGLGTLRRAVLLYAEGLADSLDPRTLLESEMGGMAELLLEDFLGDPSREEAELFGSWSHKEGQQGGESRPLAPRATLAEAVGGILLGGASLSRLGWAEGSLRRSFSTPLPLRLFRGRRRLGLLLRGRGR